MPDVQIHVSQPATFLGKQPQELLSWGLGVSFTFLGVTGTLDLQTVSNGASQEEVVCSFTLTETEFGDLKNQWNATRASVHHSTLKSMFLIPPYQKIVALGWKAVPFILAELNSSPDHWGWALEKITGENPVPDHSSGNLRAIADAWVSWGRARQLIS